MICVDRDRGATSLVVVLTAPVLVALMFMGFQAAMWNHTRTEARLVAREAAALVARDGVPVDVAATAARTTLAADSLLTDADVRIQQSGGLVTVSVSGRAPGVLRFTSVPMSVSASLPREGWVAL